MRKFAQYTIGSTALGFFTLMALTTVIAFAKMIANLETGPVKDGIEVVTFCWVVGSAIQGGHWAWRKYVG